jgi:pyruvate formate lyase activating enzyme
MKEARFYTVLDNGVVSCGLCPHACAIPENETGFCGARSNREGMLMAESYGCVSSFALDPIEKKPLYHFYPGSMIFSIGGFGCNFRCAFCQNYGISMAKPGGGRNTQHMTPEQVAAAAEHFIPQGNIGVAYTYNEPLIGYEFVLDCAKRVRERGLKNALVTNGYIRPEPLLALLPYIDALNIDLKGFTDKFYENVKGGLEAVKESIRIAADMAHVEVTTLIIPRENDGEEEIDALARFVAEVGLNIPLHLSRFFPRHQMTGKEPTPGDTILRLKKVAERHLRHVYAGNMV